MNIQIFLDDLFRLADFTPAAGVPDRHKRLPKDWIAECERENQQISKVIITYPDLDWSIEFDYNGAIVCHEKISTHYAWSDLPEYFDCTIELLRDANYKYGRQLQAYPFASAGIWNTLRCPGWMGIAILNAILKAKAADTQSPPDQ